MYGFAPHELNSFKNCTWLQPPCIDCSQENSSTAQHQLCLLMPWSRISSEPGQIRAHELVGCRKGSSRCMDPTRNYPTTAVLPLSQFEVTYQTNALVCMSFTLYTLETDLTRSFLNHMVQFCSSLIKIRTAFMCLWELLCFFFTFGNNFS